MNKAPEVTETQKRETAAFIAKLDRIIAAQGTHKNREAAKRRMALGGKS